jgi:gas vesicle protein
MDNDNGNGAFVVGFILGALAGAAAALFLTPRSGDEMRQDLEARFAGATKTIREQADEIATTASQRAQEMSGKLAAMDIPVGGGASTTGSSDPIPAPPPGATPNDPRTTLDNG